MSGIEATFVITRTPNNLTSISARSRSKINVQRIMEKLLVARSFHPAPCQLPDTSLSKAQALLLKQINEELNEYKETES